MLSTRGYTLTTAGTEKVFTYRVLENGALEPTGEPPAETAWCGVLRRCHRRVRHPRRMQP